MKYSFILCTINREVFLQKCIESIINQTYSNFEIIVIDQSDKANVEVKNMDNRIKYIHTTEKGLSHCRNIALKYVSGDYCCLMDDDAEYNHDTLETINQLILEKKCDVVSGIIIDKKTGEKWMKGMSNNDTVINIDKVFDCSSASLTIKADLLKEFKFDENFGAGTRWGCGEETDLLLRLLYHGYSIFYSPNVIIYHPKESINNQNLKKVGLYNLGYGAYFAKHIIKYNNSAMRRKFLYALIKNMIAITLYIYSSNKRKYYITCLKNKIKGYKEWKKYYKNNCEV